MVTNLENHIEDFPQRLKAYQDFLGSPYFHSFHVDTQSFLHIFCQAHRAVKFSPPSSRRAVIEKLVAFINWCSHKTLGWGEKTWKKRSFCSIPKSHLLPESSCFSEVCSRRLARQPQELRTYPITKLSLQASRYHHGCKVVSQQSGTELPPSSHSLRGKNIETRWWSSGVRGNGSLRHEAAALQPLATFLHLEPETMWLSQIKSHLSGRDK